MPSRRAPIRWPNEARIALMFAVSWETEPDDFGTNASHQRSNRGRLPENAIHKKDMGVIMDRTFGDKCGIWRILDLFEREGIKGTFFLNGRTAEENPEAVRELVLKGHELAAQPYIHEYSLMLDKEGERKAIQGSIDVFKKVADVTPVGYLSPGVRPTPNTVDLISEMGFIWSSEELMTTFPIGSDQRISLSSFCRRISIQTTTLLTKPYPVAQENYIACWWISSIIFTRRD